MGLLTPNEAAILDAIVEGRYGTPFDTLGIHPLREEGGIVVRAFLPEAEAAEVERDDGRHAMGPLHPRGIFVATFPDASGPFGYRLRVVDRVGHEQIIEDPYRFPPVLSDAELDAFVRGDDVHAWKRLGARAIEHAGIEGVCFAVWAPSAVRVSVVGAFNGWNGTRHPMRPRGATGVWELFLPDVPVGSLYKYEIRTRHGGKRTVKADPYGYEMERPPGTASIVSASSEYAWNDDHWMETRRERQRLDRPLSIYEVHLGSWRKAAAEDAPDAEVESHRDDRRAHGRNASERRWLTYRELAGELVPYVKEMGYTHLELLPVTEHPFDGSWGYQSVGYFAPTSRFGSPDDFRHFVDTAHQAGLGIILDWVPGHFPRDAHGLGYFDGTHLYEHDDPRRGLHMDWDTFIFDFGKPQVVAFLLSSAAFWLERFHIDGLRVDAVASMLYLDYSRRPGEWVPNIRGGRENLEAIEFLKKLNELVHTSFPGVLTCAEESTSWPGVTGQVADGGLGFDLKWNMGWMNDTLSYMELDPIARKHHQEKLTFSLTFAFDEHFLLPLSHDEVVHLKGSLFSKMPGDDSLRLANLRTLYGAMYAHPGKKLLFMGGELGQRSEWDHDSELSWELLEREENRQLRDYVRALNELYSRRAALHETEASWGGFEWIDCDDSERSLISFVRRGTTKNRYLVVLINFTPVARRRYRLGVPHAHEYRLVLNSDAPEFGGSGEEVPDTFRVKDLPAHERDHSIELSVPPLGVLFLEPRPKPFWSNV